MKTFVTTLAFLLLACSSKPTVDLGGNSAYAGWSDTKRSNAATTSGTPAAPEVLYQGNNVTAMAVDETTIAAIIMDEQSVHIDACQLADCKGTLQTLYVQSIGTYIESSANGTTTNGIGLTYLLVSQGEVIWQEVTTSGDHEVTPSGDFFFVLCPSSGCPSGPRTIASANNVRALTVNADSVFWLDEDRLAACPKSGCETPLSIPLSDAVQSSLFSGNSSPVLLESAGVLYASGGRGIFSVPADFSADLTPIHTDPVGVTGLAVVGEYVYFARSILTGEIRRCPISGCATSEVVTAAPDWPNNLIGDEKAVYWTHRTPEIYDSTDELYTQAISKFPLTGASAGATDMVTFEDVRYVIERPSPSINSHHVYWAEATLIPNGVTRVGGPWTPQFLRSTIKMVAR
jgi:hypothetical protein